MEIVKPHYKLKNNRIAGLRAKTIIPIFLICSVIALTAGLCDPPNTPPLDAFGNLIANVDFDVRLNYTPFDSTNTDRGQRDIFYAQEPFNSEWDCGPSVMRMWAHYMFNSAYGNKAESRVDEWEYDAIMGQIPTSWTIKNEYQSTSWDRNSYQLNVNTTWPRNALDEPYSCIRS